MVHHVLADIQINLSNEIQVIFGKNVQCSLETIINGKQQITILNKPLINGRNAYCFQKMHVNTCTFKKIPFLRR